MGTARPALAYLAGAVGFFWLLQARDGRFFILVYSLYRQVLGLLPVRWTYLGAAVVTVVPFAASGRLGGLDPGDLLAITANLALALLVGLFIRAIADQSERRRSIIAELERARAENAGLLAKVREAAVLGERQRMAREIHDTLAQGLTGIVTQLEAAEAALEGRPESVRGTWTRPGAWPARASARPGARCTTCARGRWRPGGWWTPSATWPGAGPPTVACRRW